MTALYNYNAYFNFVIMIALYNYDAYFNNGERTSKQIHTRINNGESFTQPVSHMIRITVTGNRVW